MSISLSYKTVIVPYAAVRFRFADKEIGEVGCQRAGSLVGLGKGGRGATAERFNFSSFDIRSFDNDKEILS